MTSPQGREPGPDGPVPAGASAMPSATLPSSTPADDPTAAMRRDSVPAGDQPADAPTTPAAPRAMSSTPDPARRRPDTTGPVRGAGASGLTPRPPVRTPAATGSPEAVRRPGSARSGPPRPASSTTPRAPDAGRAPVRTRRAKLALQRIDPWSVFVFTLVASLFLGVALVVAVAALYSVLGSLGVLSSVNELYVEVVGGDAGADPLLTANRFLGGAAVLAAVNVVLLTLLATLSSLLYNLCASFTGGIEVTLGERD